MSFQTLTKATSGTKAGAKENSENAENEVRVLFYVNVVGLGAKDGRHIDMEIQHGDCK